MERNNQMEKKQKTDMNVAINNEKRKTYKRNET